MNIRQKLAIGIVTTAVVATTLTGCKGPAPAEVPTETPGITNSVPSDTPKETPEITTPETSNSPLPQGQGETVTPGPSETPSQAPSETPATQDYTICGYKMSGGDAIATGGYRGSDAKSYEDFLKKTADEMNRAFAEALTGPDGKVLATFTYHFTPGTGTFNPNDKATWNRGNVTLDINNTSFQFATAGWGPGEETPYLEFDPSVFGKYTYLDLNGVKSLVQNGGKLVAAKQQSAQVADAPKIQTLVAKKPIMAKGEQVATKVKNVPAGFQYMRRV